MFPKSNFIAKFIALVGLLLIVIIALSIFRGVSQSLEAERTLHAHRTVLDVLEVYLCEHPGRWPKSWEELSQTRPRQQGAIYEWPDDMDQFRKRIHIDFALTRRQVAAMNRSSFSAVEPIGPYYEIDDIMIGNLLRAARQNAKEDKKGGQADRHLFLENKVPVLPFGPVL